MPVILDIWSHIAPQFGGIGPSAASLAAAVKAQTGWDSDLLAICNQGESERHKDIPPTVRIVTQAGFRPISDIRLRPPLFEAVAKSDVCHVHGIWLPHSLTVRKLAKKLGKPLVSSAHGMLEKWELANKKLKKEIYSHFFERPSLAHSACLRALSQQEAEDYRKFGLRNLISIIPNGIDPIESVDPADLLLQFPELCDKRVVLFLSRIHRKKGILNLLAAWPEVVRRHPEAHLLLAGGDFAGTAAIAREMVDKQQITQSVTFCGTLNGKLKLSALSLATAFCLPSYSEGMSMAVLEALSIGLPVVITRACNVDGVQESGAGYITSNEPATLAESLSEYLSLNVRRQRLMRESAKHLARTRYNWSTVGAHMYAVYEWLLGGSKPAYVLD